MNILLTGATGFIGRQIMNNFKPEDVTVLSTSDIFLNRLNFSLEDFITLDCIEEKYDVVIHLGGLAHGEFSLNRLRVVNFESTIALARQLAKRGLKRFIYVSSINVNDIPMLEKEPFEPSASNMLSNATLVKYESEIGLKKLSIEFGFELVIIRCPLVYGFNAPGNFGTLINLVSIMPCLPFGLVNNKRDFISVYNLSDLIMTCLRVPKLGSQVFFASENETVSIKEFTNAIAKGLNKKLIQLPVPVSLMRLVARLVGKSAMAEQILGNLQVDSSNVQEVLGWTPPFTMEQAMASLSENKK